MHSRGIEEASYPPDVFGVWTENKGWDEMTLEAAIARAQRLVSEYETGHVVVRDLLDADAFEVAARRRPRRRRRKAR